MIDQAFNSLYNYIQKEKYKGWDLFDGLNSQIFKHSPLYIIGDVASSLAFMDSTLLNQDNYGIQVLGNQGNK